MKAGHEVVVIFLLAILPLGCPSIDNGGDQDNSGNTNINSTNENDNRSLSVPAGFEDYQEVSFDEAGRLILDDSVDDSGTVNIYGLGFLSIGDRLDVQCIADSGSELDCMMALFDGDGDRIFWNDDIDPAASNYDAAFAGNIRHESNYFLGVTSSGFRQTTGGYRVTIERLASVEAPIALGQTIVLNWATAEEVVVGEQDYGDLPAFDAGSIDASLAAETETIQSLVLEGVRDYFEDYDVTILTSDDDAPAGNFSRVYFSADTDQNTYGRADGVDFYNGNDMDNALVFLGEFSELSTDASSVATALSNVVSREIGRLLGLMLTTDSNDLLGLAEAFSAGSLLDTKQLGSAELVDFPLGQQNSPELLEETVGLK